MEELGIYIRKIEGLHVLETNSLVCMHVENRFELDYNGLVEYYGTLYRIQNGYLNWGYSGRIWNNANGIKL